MEWNKGRTLKMVLGYTFWAAPFYNFGYKYILNKFFPGNSYLTVFKRVLTDVILLAPVNSTVFMTYGVLYDGGNQQMAIDK